MKDSIRRPFGSFPTLEIREGKENSEKKVGKEQRGKKGQTVQMTMYLYK